MIRITGDRQTVANLRQLAKGVPVADINRAAKRSMNPMLQQAKANANRNRNYVGKYPGFPQPKGGRPSVASGMVFRNMGSLMRGRRSYWIGAMRRARKLAHLLEFGTAPHKQPKFRGGWWHPGARPKPFLTPAYEAKADAVANDMARELWEALWKKATKLGRRRY